MNPKDYDFILPEFKTKSVLQYIRLYMFYHSDLPHNCEYSFFLVVTFSSRASTHNKSVPPKTNPNFQAVGPLRMTYSINLCQYWSKVCIYLNKMVHKTSKYAVVHMNISGTNNAKLSIVFQCFHLHHMISFFNPVIITNMHLHGAPCFVSFITKHACLRKAIKVGFYV